jgi:hypothetical protein
MSESIDGILGDTDEADHESDAPDSQLEDTVLGGALEALVSPIAHRPQRQRKPPHRYGEWVTPVVEGRGAAAFAFTVTEDFVHDEPSTYKEAISGP